MHAHLTLAHRDHLPFAMYSFSMFSHALCKFQCHATTFVVTLSSCVFSWITVLSCWYFSSCKCFLLLLCFILLSPFGNICWKIFSLQLGPCFLDWHITQSVEVFVSVGKKDSMISTHSTLLRFVGLKVFEEKGFYRQSSHGGQRCRKKLGLLFFW